MVACRAGTYLLNECFLLIGVAMPQEKLCPECEGPMDPSPYCGVLVCCECGHHDGLARCYCGWSESGGQWGSLARSPTLPVVRIYLLNECFLWCPEANVRTPRPGQGLVFDAAAVHAARL